MILNFIPISSELELDLKSATLAPFKLNNYSFFFLKELVFGSKVFYKRSCLSKEKRLEYHYPIQAKDLSIIYQKYKKLSMQ